MPTDRPVAINMHEAKTHLSRLVQRVERGERVIIARAGRPAAMLVPVETASARRTPGHDRVVIQPDFDAPLAGFDGTDLWPAAEGAEGAEAAEAAEASSTDPPA